MAFRNRIRIPLYLKTPQFPTEANRFRLSNGTSKTLFVVIRKNYQLTTDYMSQTMHQRLVVALNHDTVNIEGDRYVGGVSVDGEYEITWPDFLDYPLGQAGVKLQVTPFDMTNDNCKTCDQMTQLGLVDDDIGVIDEGEAKGINVFSNDDICCFPILAEIVSFATGYLDSATINAANGVATLTAKDPVSPVGNIILATYRVTCPDGTYDEADIYGSITGSGVECEQPAEFLLPVGFDDPFDGTADLEWAAPVVDPGLGYEWELYDQADPGTVLQTGTSLDKTVTLTGLNGATAYGFYVRSLCDVGVYSPYTQFLFETPGYGITCGKFIISADDGTLNSIFKYYTFMDCEGNITSHSVLNLTSKEECMLMDEFNVPIYFTAEFGVTYLYDSPC